MLKGGLVLIWELDMNLELTLIPSFLFFAESQNLPLKFGKI